MSINNGIRKRYFAFPLQYSSKIKIRREKINQERICGRISNRTDVDVIARKNNKCQLDEFSIFILLLMRRYKTENVRIMRSALKATSPNSPEILLTVAIIT